MAPKHHDLSRPKRFKVELAIGEIVLSARQIVLIAGFSILLCAAFIYLAVLPSDLVNSGEEIVRWGIYDKRALIFFYICTISLFVFIRYVALPRVPGPSIATQKQTPFWERAFEHSATGHRPSTRLAWFAFGLLLGSLCYSGGVFTNIIRPDSHLDVQLGAIEAIHNGRLPYLDAETQYGPGNQLLLYQIMSAIDFSYWGAIQAQAITNAVVIAVFCGCLVWFLGPVLGILSIFLLGAFTSPLFVAAFPGWGWLTRWMGPAIISLCLAEAIFSAPLRLREVIVFAIGGAWGLFSFISQESSAPGLLSCAIITGFAAGLRVISYQQSIVYAIYIITGGTAAFFGLSVWLVGIANVTKLVQLYFLGSSRVVAGIANTPWRQWEFASASETLIYHLSFLFLSISIILMCLYMPIPKGNLQRNAQKIMVGVVAGAASLAVPTLFRADTFHLWGPSFLLGAFFLLGVTTLPQALAINRLAKSVIGASFAVVLGGALLIKLSAGQLIDYGNPAGATAGLAQIFNVPKDDGGRHSERLNEHLEFVLKRIAGQPERRKKLLSFYGQVAELVAELRGELNGRRVVFDDPPNKKQDGLQVLPGLLYFLAGFPPISAITEPLISVWLSSDYARWQQDIGRNSPDCLVTTTTDLDGDPMIRWFVRAYELDPAKDGRRLHHFLVLCRRTG
jgi:hypothetical protein